MSSAIDMISYFFGSKFPRIWIPGKTDTLLEEGNKRPGFRSFDILQNFGFEFYERKKQVSLHLLTLQLS